VSRYIGQLAQLKMLNWGGRQSFLSVHDPLLSSQRNGLSLQGLPVGGNGSRGGSGGGK